MQSKEPSTIDRKEALAILTGQTPLYDDLARAAGQREKFFGKTVRIHILDNIKNGRCAEDCGYCAQRKDAGSGIQDYPLKSEAEIFADAVAAKENGAYRFCMVTSGTGPSVSGTERLAGVIRRITDELGMRVCLSAGLLDGDKAKVLAAAGLDRYNHNLNTSEKHYGEICTTHSYADRKDTLGALNAAGVGLCSGLIVGMGESDDDIVEAVFALKDFRVISIPVNFFIPVPGHAVKNPRALTPEFCLRVLIMFRLIHPDSEIRIAAGREGHLRGLQSTALMVANSLFASGYLNVKGSNISETVALIRDAGYEPEIEGARSAPEGEPGIAGDFSYTAENLPRLLKFQAP